MDFLKTDAVSGRIIAASLNLEPTMTHMPLNPTVVSFFDHATATWSYVVYAKEHADRRCAIIDSVLDFDLSSGRTFTHSCDRLIEFVRTHDLKLEWILETHIHADHLTGAAYLKEKLGGKTGISRHILDVLKTWEPIFHNEANTPRDGAQFDHLFEDDEVFTIGGLSARIIHTPGHTPADTSYIIGDTVFVGDAMFLPDVGTGRCDFPGGSAKDSFASCAKLLNLPEDTRMYVGHDYPPEGKRPPMCMTTVGAQRHANVRVHGGVTRDAFVAKRETDDKGKAVPHLLLPSIQVNLRAGRLGVDGEEPFLKIPLNKLS
ncbi:MAG: MBL fold metallo-hydrolase [Proteobacteria bacterium]|nr:MBL fold metallo-hydrolase [Pseudomonadota bacterium]